MKPRPNIILIVADDMGYGDFSAFNNGLTHTPALDQMMREGLSLTQHYSSSPVCAPARAALLTGRYPHRTGCIDTLDARGLDRVALNETMLPAVFAANGYRTGLIGKWHNGCFDRRYHPNSRGFHEFAGFSGGWQNYYDWNLDRNGSFTHSDGRYLTDVLTDEATGFIMRNCNQPFFLHLAYNAPHFPLQAPTEDLKPYEDTGEYTHGVSCIYAMIQRMDRGITRIMETLDELGLDKNTLVIFTSDNGPQFGGEGKWCTNRFNCGFRGSKLLVYEGGIRVPMIARLPEAIAPGTQSDAFVHGTDIFPTLLSFAGIPLPDNLKLDGQNISPLLAGDGCNITPRRFWQWNRYSPVGACNAAMRDGPWKIVRPAIGAAMSVSKQDYALDKASKQYPLTFQPTLNTPDPPREIPAPQPVQLFNLDEDPCESNDLAAIHPGRVARMLAQLETWFEDVNNTVH